MRKETKYDIGDALVRTHCRFRSVRMQFNEPVELVKRLLRRPCVLIKMRNLI